MRVKFVLSALCMLLLVSFKVKDVQKVTSVKVYQHFLRNGSPGEILNACVNPGPWHVDTSANQNIALPVDSVNHIISTAYKKHFSFFGFKLGNIDFAGEWVMDNKIHYFVYTTPDEPYKGEFLDYTAKTAYLIK